MVAPPKKDRRSTVADEIKAKKRHIKPNKHFIKLKVKNKEIKDDVDEFGKPKKKNPGMGRSTKQWRAMKRLQVKSIDKLRIARKGVWRVFRGCLELSTIEYSKILNRPGSVNYQITQRALDQIHTIVERQLLNRMQIARLLTAEPSRKGDPKKEGTRAWFERQLELRREDAKTPAERKEVEEEIEQELERWKQVEECRGPLVYRNQKTLNLDQVGTANVLITRGANFRM